MSKQARIGKIAPGVLSQLLQKYAAKKGNKVVVGPAVGLDAAVISLEKGNFVVASDPVTYASEYMGWYVVHINANDIFVSGAKPRWFLADVLLPPGKHGLAERVFRHINQACSELGVSLIGGHTEITPALNKPIVTGFMIGVAEKKVLTAGNVRPSDRIILTKGVAIEGTALIAREFEKQLNKNVSMNLIRKAKRFLKDPGLSVGKEAIIAAENGTNAMQCMIQQKVAWSTAFGKWLMRPTVQST